MPEVVFPDPSLSDDRVLLRPWALSDLAFVVDACQDPAISRYSPVIPFPYTKADAKEWFDNQEPARLAGHHLDLAVVEATTGQGLGAISLGQINTRLVTAEVGYWLAPEARGFGQISRAVRLLAGWAFEALSLARLTLTTDPENFASQRVAERCGFRQEGRLRSDLVIRHNGHRRDSLVYGLLPGELT